MKLSPVKQTEVDGLRFYHLRGGSPPQDPQLFAKLGAEFHQRLDSVKGDTAIDVGANIGSYTLRLARNFRLVIAFEPNPRISRLLRLNVALNKFKNVQVQEMALSDVNGIVPFYVDSRKDGASSLDPSRLGNNYDEIVQSKTVRIDDIPLEAGSLDLIKIDTEGLELQVLKGASRTIAKFRPTLAVEVHNPKVISGNVCVCEVCSLLRLLDYQILVTGESFAAGPVHWVWASIK